MARYPVCCVAEVSLAGLDRLLNEALAGSEELVPNSEHELSIVVEENDGSSKLPGEATVPPLGSTFKPFVAASVDDAARHIGDACYFAVLDQECTNNDTATLVHHQEDGSNTTVRVTLKSVQHVLVSLSVASLGFQEIQRIANSQGGVYGINERGLNKGRPAPPMKLGRA
ncbi:hypothetical protein F5Y12DRAFT_778690 [Xylaria sp. FL1777]|nr:hypothetical protein F5Y12DRAFT_778690 [Xylaria sp. FL1777]